MRYEWTISLRYLKSRRRTMVSLITLISVVGVALGVAVLILVLSVLGGFASDLREKILGTKAHVVVSAERGPLAGAEQVMAAARQLPEVIGASAYIESEVMITSDSQVVGVVMRGIDPATVGETSSLPDNVIDGELNWLRDPQQAVEARLANEPPRYRELVRDYEDVIREADILQQETESLQRGIEDAAEFRRRWRAERQRRMGSGEGTGFEALEGSGEGTGPSIETAGQGSGSGAPSGPVMPLLPGQGRPATRPTPPAEGSGQRVVMPLLPGQGSPARPGPGTALGTGADTASPMPELPSTERPRRRQLPGILIGTELASSLHVSVGEEVTVINPDGQILPTGPAPMSRPFIVVGQFYSGLYEFDRRYVYILTEEAADLMRVPDGMVTAVDLKLSDLDSARAVATTLQAELTGEGMDNVLVRGWEVLNKSLFSALELEKVALFVILTIIILVASFSIASSLVVMVVERGEEIAILKSMGASNREIMGIFTIAGGIIGAIGTLVGVSVGVALCLLVKQYGYPLDTDVYYIEYLPIHLDPREVVLTALAGMVISLLATAYPAVKAARLNPAEALRNE